MKRRQDSPSGRRTKLIKFSQLIQCDDNKIKTISLKNLHRLLMNSSLVDASENRDKDPPKFQQKQKELVIPADPPSAHWRRRNKSTAHNTPTVILNLFQDPINKIFLIVSHEDSIKLKV